MFKRILAALLAFVAVTAFAAVDINKATQAELEGVKGVGTATAARILDARKKGVFKNWGDVMQRVAGVKGAKAGKLSAAGLTVNGESFTASAMPARTRKPPHKTAQAGAKAADALQKK